MSVQRPSPFENVRHHIIYLLLYIHLKQSSKTHFIPAGRSALQHRALFRADTIRYSALSTRRRVRSTMGAAPTAVAPAAHAGNTFAQTQAAAAGRAASE